MFRDVRVCENRDSKFPGSLYDGFLVLTVLPWADLNLDGSYRVNLEHPQPSPSIYGENGIRNEITYDMGSPKRGGAALGGADILELPLLH